MHGISIGRQYGPTSFTGHGRTTTRRRRRVVEHHRSTPLAGQPMETVSSDRRREQMPQPDMTIGSRTHLWRPTRIITWSQGRRRDKNSH